MISMRQVSLDEFLGLPWPARVRTAISRMAKREEILGVSASGPDSDLVATAWDSLPVRWPAGTSWVYLKGESKPDQEMAQTKTDRAIELVNGGMSVYAAAKQVGVDHGSVYRAIKRAQERGTCPHCGQILPPGFKDPSPGSAGA